MKFTPKCTSKTPIWLYAESCQLFHIGLELMIAANCNIFDAPMLTKVSVHSGTFG